jgi:hypothetical protein
MLRTAAYSYKYLPPKTTNVFLVCDMDHDAHWSTRKVWTSGTRLSKAVPTVIAFQCPSQATNMCKELEPTTSCVVETNLEYADFMAQQMRLPFLVFMSASSELGSGGSSIIECSVRMNKPEIKRE